MLQIKLVPLERNAELFSLQPSSPPRQTPLSHGSETGGRDSGTLLSDNAALGPEHLVELGSS